MPQPDADGPAARRLPTADGAASLDDLARVPELRRVLIDHAYRGFRVQTILRAFAIGFCALTLWLLPPAAAALAGWLIVAAYAVAAAGVVVLVRRDDARVLRFSWAALYVDVVALGLLTVVVSLTDEMSYTADVLINALYLVPVLAAVQLRLWAAVSVMVPTVAVFLGVGVAALRSSGAPDEALALRTLALVGVCLGCALLVRVQRSRVLAIGRAATHRQALLRELLETEDRERLELSAQLHDGALQYLLAARQDLDDLPPDTDPALAERLRYALGEASAQLRSHVADVNPAVLQQAGLVAAVQRLADDAAARGRIAVTTDAAHWRAATPEVDRLLYDTARELLANVVRHAQARTARVTLASDGATARLEVADDGRGTDAATLAARLAEGHVGLAARRLRLEAAGGGFTIRPREGGGTLAVATVPLGPGA